MTLTAEQAQALLARLIAANPTDLDKPMTLDEFAAWMGMKKREVQIRVQRHEIPVMRVSRKNLRFHPRTVIDALHKR